MAQHVFRPNSETELINVVFVLLNAVLMVKQENGRMDRGASKLGRLAARITIWTDDRTVVDDDGCRRMPPVRDDGITTITNSAYPRRVTSLLMNRYAKSSWYVGIFQSRFFLF